jgi:hypothetical protein
MEPHNTLAERALDIVFKHSTIRAQDLWVQLNRKDIDFWTKEKIPIDWSEYDVDCFPHKSDGPMFCPNSMCGCPDSNYIFYANVISIGAQLNRASREEVKVPMLRSMHSKFDCIIGYGHEYYAKEDAELLSRVASIIKEYIFAYRLLDPQFAAEMELLFRVDLIPQDVLIGWAWEYDVEDNRNYPRRHRSFLWWESPPL